MRTTKKAETDNTKIKDLNCKKQQMNFEKTMGISPKMNKKGE